MALSEMQRRLLALVRKTEARPGPRLTFASAGEALGCSRARVHQVAMEMRKAGLLADDRTLYSTSAGRRVAL